MPRTSPPPAFGATHHVPGSGSVPVPSRRSWSPPGALSMGKPGPEEAGWVLPQISAGLVPCAWPGPQPCLEPARGWAGLGGSPMEQAEPGSSRAARMGAHGSCRARPQAFGKGPWLRHRERESREVAQLHGAAGAWDLADPGAPRWSRALEPGPRSCQEPRGSVPAPRPATPAPPPAAHPCPPAEPSCN